MCDSRSIRALGLGLLPLLGLVLLLAAPDTASAQEIQPLMQGSEQHFSVTWDAIQRRGRTEVEGYVINRSPYRVGRMRVLVDSLDASNRVVDQKVAWVPGELAGDDRLYYSVAVAPAAQYRVRVFSYDRIEYAQIMSP
jgi:hypothetical protein